LTLDYDCMASDLVAKHAVPLGEPDRDPGALDGVGVFDRRLGELRRHRPDQLVRRGACSMRVASERMVFSSNISTSFSRFR